MRRVDAFYLVHCQRVVLEPVEEAPVSSYHLHPIATTRNLLHLFTITGSPRVLAFWRCACAEKKLAEVSSRTDAGVVV
jgi:hypothetical protein